MGGGNEEGGTHGRDRHKTRMESLQTKTTFTTINNAHVICRNENSHNVVRRIHDLHLYSDPSVPVLMVKGA